MKDGVYMEIQLLRHATILITVNGKKLLVDPMLSEKEAMAPIVNSSNDRRNPLVELRIPQDDYLDKIHAVLLTHTHRDHFDDAAAEKLPKHIPVLCQPEDTGKLAALGFKFVMPVDAELLWEGIRFIRTQGQHGTGDIGQMMAPVSGFIIKAPESPSVYIAGDTIYCAEVEDALAAYRPDITVVNAGGARFNTGDPITMTAEDVGKVLKFAPEARVIAVHLEAINHCLVTRADIRKYLDTEKLGHRVYIPADGEKLAF